MIKFKCIEIPRDYKTNMFRVGEVYVSFDKDIKTTATGQTENHIFKVQDALGHVRMLYDDRKSIIKFCVGHVPNDLNLSTARYAIFERVN